MDQQRYRPSAAVRASASDDGLILLDVHGGLVLSCNEVGARIWRLIAEERTSGEIAQRLVDHYDIPTERARRDVAVFVADLVARGLVAVDPSR